VSRWTRAQPLILIVDDCEEHYELYSEALATGGFQVIGAGDGREGVERAQRTQPDLIILDLGLPILDGCEATRQLKADPRTRIIPILILTGYVRTGVLEAARRAGADAVLSKPCSLDRLLEEAALLLAGGRIPWAEGGRGWAAAATAR
jgi:two-component system, cell cycle response regulator DivK